MKTSRNQMVERADLFRTLAKTRRNRGLHTGKSAAGWNFKRPQAAAGSWDAIVSVARDGWQSAAREAVNSFRVEALNGPGHDVYSVEF